MDLSADTRISFAPHVVTRVVDDTLAILDVNSGAYFAIDDMGALLMQMSESGVDLGRIADRVATEYEVTREQALEDLIELAEDLVREGLVEIRGPEE